MATPAGAATLTFSLKQDGTKLTGTIQFPQGATAPLVEGKVNGDTIAFSFDNAFDRHRYMSDGTIKGQTITMVWTPGGDVLTLERQK